MTTHDTYQTAHPKCPHCGYELDDDDMLSHLTDEDLYALAPDEGSTALKCPQCDMEYAVRGGYQPHYTSAFSLDELP